MTHVLDRAARTRAIAAMTDDVGIDILVVGGGVTGAGIALDAATRGLRVGIVEAQDWASGTSSRSSKLIHGGLRYLQMLDFKLVNEALVERGLLLEQLAPHLVRPVPFLYPLDSPWERPYVGAGVGLYDVLAMIGADNKRGVPGHKHLGAKSVQAQFPGMRPDTYVGAVRYYDATVDDARLVLSLIRTAAFYGAHCASRAEVVKMTKVGGDRVDGAIIRDTETGTEHRIRAGTVITATGVWTEDTQHLATSGKGLKVLASKGIHVVVDRDRIEGRSGVILQTEKSVLFIIPWSRYWIIGTTDTPYTGDLVHPVANATDIDYVLAQTNRILVDPLTREDVIGTWAGLRPLLQPTKESDGGSAKVSREHTVLEVVPGLVSIAGGKLTTYRVMAEDAVNLTLGRKRAKELPSLTDSTPLIGGSGYRAYARQAGRIAQRYRWTEDRVAHLLHRYGSDLWNLLESVDQRPELAEPVPGAEAYIAAEIVYAVTHEGAFHLGDVMTTRTRISYEVRDHGLAAVEFIADLMAAELGWTAERRARQVAAYRARCAAEDAATAHPDDEGAQQARGRAGDLVDILPDASAQPGG